MKILILLALILATEANTGLKINPQVSADQDIPEDAKLTVPELIKKYGYPIEIHTVTTSDGYILEIHRIPHGIKGPTGKERPVLVQHGILCSSAEWVTPGPKNGLGYILADAGYDVWLTNSRGNTYSRNHTHLDPDKNAKKFWNFSWHEMGIHDLPTSIDYIIEQTKEEKVFFIAHSQGTTVFYVMASERPEYNNKVSVAINLAPTTYMRHMFSPIMRIISWTQPVLGPVSRLIGAYEFLPHSKLINVVSSSLCGDDSRVQPLCTNALFTIVGFNRKQMNTSLIPVMTGHAPAGSSTKQVLHFGQLHKSGKFRQYDFGKIGNKRRYGRFTPPKYNLKKVSTPVYIFYSKNDWMSSYRDVRKLVKELPNLKGKFLVEDKKFNHMDYLYAIDAPKFVYVRILGLMRRH